ncbi:MAG: hypothetical protein J0L96_10395 [Anaerolineae bacterium]|nr:hypothetical protein [Anaerolineae bacterium]
MDNLINALQETIQFLQDSQDPIYSHLTVAEIIQQLEKELANIKNSQPIDKNRLSLLFAPTGGIQETSIDNGWGQEFLELSSVVDNYL